MSTAAFWVVDLALPPDRIESCVSWLDSAERDRAARFLRPADRARYVVSHAALRWILADALGQAPTDIRFTAGPGGKPILVGQSVAFNLSHSGQRALIGVTAGPAIGVDVEAIRPLPEALRIARAHFAADEAAILAGLPGETVGTAFFGLWTRKEAVVKALGTGLSLPLDRFSVSVPPAPPRLLRQAGPAGLWTLATVEAGPGYVATIAIRAPAIELVARVLPPTWAERIG